MALTKATITNLDTKKAITCLFNPTEYTIAKQVNWQPKPVVGKNAPKVQFTGGGGRTLSLELFLDVCEEKNGDVRKHVDQLWELTMIDEGTKSQATKRSRPPLCLFQWGGNWSFKAVVTSLSVRYTLFRPDGIPVRATATISLQEASDSEDQPRQNPTSGTEAGHKRREVRPFDTLPLIAHEEYGDPNLWRHIAEANGLDDPLSLKPGQILSIPVVG